MNDALDYLNGESPGLGDIFLDDIQHGIDLIVRTRRLLQLSRDMHGESLCPDSLIRLSIPLAERKYVFLQ